MKKILFLTAILFTALSFTSCEKSRNGGSLTIDAKVENGHYLNNSVDEVRAMWSEIMIASAPFENGGFKITLPEEIDERTLRPITLYFEWEISNGIKISNENVEMTRISYFKAYKNNEYIDADFSFYGRSKTKYGSVSFIYVDTDVKITGSFKNNGNTFEYDLDLKKGWNTAYQTGGGMTTKKPNIDFKWHFDYNSYE